MIAEGYICENRSPCMTYVVADAVSSGERPLHRRGTLKVPLTNQHPDYGLYRPPPWALPSSHLKDKVERSDELLEGQALLRPWRPPCIQAGLRLDVARPMRI